jgi:ribonuclease HI
MFLTVTIWHLWTTRNDVRNGKPLRAPHSVAYQIQAYAEMIELHLFKPQSSTRHDTTISGVRWSPPPEGTVYINCDAALFSSLRRMGLGVVIRNHIGQYVAACRELHEEVTTPEVVEALALRRALSLAGDEGFSKIMVVSDCLSLVQRVLAPRMDRSSVGVVVQDIKALAQDFEAFSLSHVFHQFNESAHILARSTERYVVFFFCF